MVVNLLSEGWYVFLARFKLQHVHDRKEKRGRSCEREMLSCWALMVVKRSWRRREGGGGGGEKGWCGDLSCGVGRGRPMGPKKKLKKVNSWRSSVSSV